MPHSSLVLTPEEALNLSQDQQITLIDVRNPDEWEQTGVAPKAHLIPLSDPEFIQHLVNVVGDGKDEPLAIICAAGGRSFRVQQYLIQQGFTKVYNVIEGMSGGNHGIGWVAKGLPTTPYTAS